MRRQLRIEYPGAIYHLMNRGDRREPIFLNDADRIRFLETLGECSAKTSWQVHAYCLMSNHFHLVVETPLQLWLRAFSWLLGGVVLPFGEAVLINITAGATTGILGAIVADAISDAF